MTIGVGIAAALVESCRGSFAVITISAGWCNAYRCNACVIEGACRHLIKDRMDITGARWSLQGAEAVLRLRALRASGDLQAYWRFHTDREQASNHDIHYVDAKPPTIPTRPAGRPHLCLVTS